MQISLGTSTNPDISGSPGSFTVATFLTDDGGTNYYAVDTSTYSSVSITTGTLTSPAVSANSTIAYDSSVQYNISFTTQHNVVQNGYVTIDFPSTITIEDTSAAVAGCQAGINTGGTTTAAACTVTSSQVVVTDLFTSGAATGSIIVLVPGVRNARSLSTSSSFTVTTSDSSGNNIDTLSSGFTIAMTSVSDLQVVTVTNTNSTALNGFFDIYQVVVTAQTPTVNGDVLLVQFPTAFTFPTLSSSLSCAAGTNVTTIS